MQRMDLVTGRVQSGDRDPAPADLRLVQDYVNTLDRENGVELLDPDGLRAWLAHRALPGAAGAPTTTGLERALALREALRTLLLVHTGGPDDPAAREVLAATAARARLRAVFDAGAVGLEPAADGLDAALGAVVAVAFAAMLDGRWARLKACPREACGWAFYDRSPPNRGTWCSMRVCGNRVKAGTYYRRRVAR